MLFFPEGYFEDEVRDGFYISGLMKRCWAAQMEVLSDIDRVCRRYNIRWYADCGTLLGAVRHGGFVPWDDDLDICMFRDDYHRFLSVASRELTNMWPGYKILNYHDGEYWEPISRIVNSDDVDFSDVRLEKFHGYPLAAGIDIFPLDFVCPNEEEENARKDLFKAIFDLADSDYAESVDRSMLEELAISVGKRYDSTKSAKIQLYEWGEIVSSLYRREEATHVCLMHFWYKHNNHLYPMKLFEKVIELPFENMTISAPAGYDQILKIEYGDYMKLVRAGGIHDYPHYDDQVAMANEWLGEASPFKKSIKKEEVSKYIRNNTEKSVGNYVKEKSISIITLLFEAHKEIGILLQADNIYDAVNLLAQCQEAAIKIGTLIEEKNGEGVITVSYLEKYCELVYQVSEKISIGDTTNIGVLDEQLGVVRESIDKDLPDIKEVVFLPFKPEYWNTMDKLYKKIQDDPSVRTVVIPIPYYEKNACGKLVYKNYDITGYPDYVELSDYRSYDFETRHPDKIIIQYPYDNDNFVTTIDPLFYATNLRQYTNELVYIPYFKTEEIGPGEEKAYKVMSEYVLSPAVVFSDKVMVQSENIGKLYVKKLVEFFGEETKEIWESRIDGSATYLYERNSHLSKDRITMPDDWKKIIFKSDGKEKKVIVYRTSISGLFEHGNKMIDKMRSVFKTFIDNSEEVAVIWCPDKLVEATIPTTDPALYEKYSRIVEEYRSDGFGIYDDSEDYDRLIELSDAYYGDADKMVQLFRNSGLPIMIQNVEV